MEIKHLTVPDGTDIVYRVDGKGERWVVIANGYGSTWVCWRKLWAHLAPHYRLLTWDYRGLYDSAVPPDRTRLRVQDQAADLHAILAAEGIERAVLVGWSVGVQVVLEAAKAPHLAQALVLINGSPGRILHQAFDGNLAHHILRPFCWGAQHTFPHLTPLFNTLIRWPPTVPILRRLGVFAANELHFAQSLREFQRLDYDIYFRMVALADDHDASEVLRELDVPVLITTGPRDILTPPRVGRAMAALARRPELHEIPTSSHYLLIEYPETVNGLVGAFLDRHVPEGRLVVQREAERVEG